MKALQTGFQEERMKIKRTQGFHPRRVKFDFHTNPDERPSNGLSEAMMKIKRAQGFHPRRVKFDFHTNDWLDLSWKLVYDYYKSSQI